MSVSQPGSICLDEFRGLTSGTFLEPLKFPRRYLIELAGATGTFRNRGERRNLPA